VTYSGGGIFSGLHSPQMRQCRSTYPTASRSPLRVASRKSRLTRFSQQALAPSGSFAFAWSNRNASKELARTRRDSYGRNVPTAPLTQRSGHSAPFMRERRGRTRAVCVAGLFSTELGQSKRVASAQCKASSRYQAKPHVVLPAIDSAETMVSSLGKTDRTFRGDFRNISVRPAERENQDWLKEQARRYSAKEGAELAGTSERAFENFRQGRNKISFDNMVNWARNDPEFLAAFVQHCGGQLNYPPEIVAAITKLARWQENENSMRGLD
jgi:hypothetical protein